ncbi:hypothetical protein ACFL01_02670 [Planctomycetota bacterium]
MRLMSRSRLRGLEVLDGFDFSPVPTEWSHTFGDNGEFSIGIANDFESRRSAYALVYRLYRKEGYAEANDSRMWLSFHNLLPDTVTLIVKRGEEMVGTLTVVFDSPIGLPCDRVYRSEIDSLREAGRMPAEIISLGVAEEDRRVSRDILVKLFNYVYLVSWHLRGAADFVITVNPHHAAYYRKTLLFENWGPERTYKKVGGAPAVLLRLNLEIPDKAVAEPDNRELRERTHYRFFHTTEDEREILPNLKSLLDPMSEEEFYFFAMGETEIWNSASTAQKEHLSGFYFTALLGFEGDRTAFANAPSVVPGLADVAAVA